MIQDPGETPQSIVRAWTRRVPENTWGVGYRPLDDDLGEMTTWHGHYRYVYSRGLCILILIRSRI